MAFNCQEIKKISYLLALFCQATVTLTYSSTAMILFRGGPAWGSEIEEFLKLFL